VENDEAKQSLVQPPLLNGYLKKLGDRGIKTYKRRYFRQAGMKVSYYESENDKLDHAKGVINLEQIQDVKKSTGHQNAFELVSRESKRTYVLQVCEPGETVDMWMGKFQAWVKYVKETLWQRAQASMLPTAGVSSNPSYGGGDGGASGGRPSSVRLTSDLLKLSSYTTVDSAAVNEQLMGLPDDQWPQLLEDTEAEVSAQLVAITTMKAEVEELNQKYKMMGNAKEGAVERARLALQEELKSLEKQIADSQKTLIDADQSLTCKERSVMVQERCLASSSELVDLKEAILRALKTQIETFKSEIQGQENSLSALREAQQQDPSITQMHVTASMEVPLGRLRRQWEANTEQQLVNDQISRQIRKLDSLSKTYEQIATQSMEKLKTAIDGHQQALQTIRNELAVAQHAEVSVVDDFESLRKKYFVSLTICIKLQGEVTGRKPAVDLSDLDGLFQQAMAEKPDHMDWNDWLADKLFPGTPKSLILGRRRAGSSAAPTHVR
jgi:hypothetical protein